MDTATNSSDTSTKPIGAPSATNGNDDSSPHADPEQGGAGGNERGMHATYGRFAAMITTSTVVMFGLMYINSYALDHVRWSETRFYMALLMGGVMAAIMLGFMLSMYKSAKMNIAIFVLAIAVSVGSLALVRSQVTVQDSSWMRAMIPHHSIAILTSERAEIDDVRVCALAKSIVEAQQREIDEMDWLISDIAANGAATTAAEAAARPVPDFVGEAIRDCP